MRLLGFRQYPLGLFERRKLPMPYVAHFSAVDTVFHGVVLRL